MLYSALFIGLSIGLAEEFDVAEVDTQDQPDDNIEVVAESPGCNYFSDGLGLHPIGICTGTKFNKIGLQTETDRSVLYTCAPDNSHVIRFQYIESATCSGDYQSSIATSDVDQFVCGEQSTCSYVVSTEHSMHGKMTGEIRKWASTAYVTNRCANGKKYACSDNTAYSVASFGNEDCDISEEDVSVEEAWVSATDEPSKADYTYREVFCNQPDPLLTVLSLPQAETVSIAIETAVCLNGRQTGNHREVGKEQVSYCFLEYDAHGKPVYKGEFAEIRWTPLAGTLGPAYGLFLYGTEEDPADGFPMAYCFSGNTNDISGCSGEWYVEHGSSTRYYKDLDMQVTECACMVDEEMFSLHPPSVNGVEQEEDKPSMVAEASGAMSHGFGFAMLAGLVALFR